MLNFNFIVVILNMFTIFAYNYNVCGFVQAGKIKPNN